ncbi:hypothetical protein [Thermovirga lienii]|jgi:hypothetical protein|uniref:hypothetical protein n=1 Tax=Thermovirga lienii TaxID=336261 RepID=UPI002FE0F101
MTKQEILKKMKEIKENPITLPRRATLGEYAQLYDALYDRLAEVVCLAQQIVNMPCVAGAQFCQQEMEKINAKIELIEKIFAKQMAADAKRRQMAETYAKEIMQKAYEQIYKEKAVNINVGVNM